MEVLRFPPSSPRPAGAPASAANVWERLLQTFAVPAPVANRFLPKIKAGPLLLEVGQPPEWKPFEVVLAGANAADLGLYYYPHKDAATPAGCIRLQNAHMDSLEEVLMVVTKDKTWFLCADHVRDASDWSDAICSAIERVTSEGLQERPTQRRRLDSGVSAVTLCELQSRGAKARVDEFLEVFVRSTREDMCLQAAKGALSWSCMRGLTWKVWLDCIPADVPFSQWGSIAREKRQRYEKERCKQHLFLDLLVGKQRPEEFLTRCETSTDNLLYSIYKDVRRTRGEMPYFRDPVVQCLMIRVLYVYSATHSEISYNQGMGELLATLVYLLHIEQWPLEEDDVEEVLAEEYDVEPDGHLADSYFFPASSPAKEQAEDTSTEEEDPSYVYVESFINIQNDDSYLDRDTFLRLAPFAGGSGKYYECCRDAAGEIVRELTASEFIEHDAYLLLEEMMLRMAGTYCPHVPLSRRNSKPQVEKPLSSADQLPASPLDDQMNRIHHHILSRCDPPTARHLAKLGVEPQIFLLRWVRVLMAREFETPQVWHIWDAIFSLTPSDFSFINLLCVAVVREFREEILAAEDATNVLLSLRDISDRIEPARLVDNARELYDALLIAAAVEASMGSDLT
ncbi:TBC1 domain, member 5 [Phytophthora pseudosyringae]|uniref:TBC1 domain, member 5 n=1 Tax=Phytophthora pseudosyringae TaxID=221518 RepID=A0A8T1WBH6_9STRA|nr:TBC1 domain, member 5 [Phytophthora pseudosyringae]